MSPTSEPASTKDSRNSKKAFTPHRSMFRFLIYPGKQLKYAYFHFLIVGLAVLIVNAAAYYKYSQLVQINTHVATQSLLYEYITFISLITIVTLVLVGVCTFFIVIIFLHRFVGPMLPLLRHLEALLAKDYSYRTFLRSDDEIKELGQKLNEVSEQLQKNR